MAFKAETKKFKREKYIMKQLFFNCKNRILEHLIGSYPNYTVHEVSNMAKEYGINHVDLYTYFFYEFRSDKFYKFDFEKERRFLAIFSNINKKGFRDLLVDVYSPLMPDNKDIIEFDGLLKCGYYNRQSERKEILEKLVETNRPFLKFVEDSVIEEERQNLQNAVKDLGIDNNRRKM